MRVCPQCDRRYVAGEAFCPYDGARLRSEASLQRAASDDDPFAGRVLAGRYRLERVLGRGGMGTVYAARQVALEKPCAIKLLRPVLDDDGQALGRFEREARAASSLGNEHIVDVFDFVKTSDGLAFLAMELLDGEDLGDVLARDGRLSLQRAAAIVLQCCEALQAAHAAGIVHRDLKPENIFLVTRPEHPEFVKVVDFGLAKFSDTEQQGDPSRKLTKTGMIFGTPQYMSPEQCMGRPVDPRADVYALGLIFYELLVGRVPFDADSFMGIVNQHLVDPPPRMRELCPDLVVPEAVEALVYRCLEKKPASRPQSMAQLRDELLAALRTSGEHALAARFEEPPPDAEGEAAAALQLVRKKPSAHPPAASSPVPLSLEDTQLAMPPVPSPPASAPQAAAPVSEAWSSGDARARVPTPTARTRAPRLDVEATRRPVGWRGRGPLWWLGFAVGLLALGGLLGYVLVLVG